VWREQAFDPSLLGILVNPFFIARRALIRRLRAVAPAISGRVLDVGCGQRPYQKLFTTQEYVGLELDTPENRTKPADVFYDGKTFPFPAASFDSVICNQVLEHVFEPDRFLAEVTRVLRPEGRLLLSVPFVWDEHEQPYDFARYSSFGLRALLERNGLRVLEMHRTVADGSLLAQLSIAMVHKRLWKSGAMGKIITMLWAVPATLAGITVARLLPCTRDLFLDNVVMAVKGEPYE
jgi:SAM-dependent methyltransferase